MRVGRVGLQHRREPDTLTRPVRPPQVMRRPIASGRNPTRDLGASTPGSGSRRSPPAPARPLRSASRHPLNPNTGATSGAEFAASAGTTAPPRRPRRTPSPMATATAILDTLRTQLDTTEYKKLHWEGTFSDYLNTVLETPGVTRTAYQRLYDMILSHGVEEVYENKDKLPRYKFFTDFAARHGDGIYGLDRSLNQLVNTFMSAALGYGTERRVILLHGPVGSAKSTIARLLKRGLEEYSRSDAGQLFSFAWKNEDGNGWTKDPMHGEPLQLVPEEHRAQILTMLNDQCKKPHAYEVGIKGDLSPYSRYEYKT